MKDIRAGVLGDKNRLTNGKEPEFCSTGQRMRLSQLQNDIEKGLIVNLALVIAL